MIEWRQSSWLLKSMTEKPNLFETTSAHQILFTKLLSIELKSIYNYCAWISFEPVTKLLKCKRSCPKIQDLGCHARLILKFSFELIYFYLLPQTRLQESKTRLSGSVSCSGGDNNEGLLLSKPEDGGRQFFVNDSIIGRPSGAFIAKVMFV